ncbi:precorrin-3B synthase [Paraburkholderia sp.]|uniref:precorrin-3B synthase n=1 Tax=Paraburkholderia sp. TaxID=1926495 RepID=UPI0026238C56|nr:precorrin-3B synthase [Paraburkholderia sp.]
MRPSACPGLLRIVAARDGGICRIKLPGGALRADQANAIADASDEYASGVIELTNRANLQLRGVRAGHEAALIGALLSAGLGPTGDAAADDVRNLMISPTAGRDPLALFDTTTLAADILSLLQSEPHFAALSPKFAMMLDGGERLAMVEHPHDVWFCAMPAVQGAKHVRFAFGFAGCPPIDGAPSDSAALAAIAPDQVVPTVAALLRTFLELATPDQSRMRDLLTTYDAEIILTHAQRNLGFPLQRDASVTAWRRPAADPSLRFGMHAQMHAHTSYVGAQASLGRIDTATLRELAAISHACAGGMLHVTPWQGIVLPDVDTAIAPDVLARVAALGLACSADDPFARVIACAGSTGCAKSLADTKADAQRLATCLPDGVADIHLTGCLRSCAAAHRAAWTLLAQAPGIYDLYRRDDTQPGPGACVAHHLTIEQAADALARLARSPIDA